MNKRNTIGCWLMVCVMALGLFHDFMAQEVSVTTNQDVTLIGTDIARDTETTGTNESPVTPPLDPSIFPKGADAIWLALIPPITFTITWLIGKIPPLPKELLPWIAPVVGILLGVIFEQANKFNWPWWSQAGAGALATWLYQLAKDATNAGPRSLLTPTPKPPEGYKPQPPLQ